LEIPLTFSFSSFSFIPRLAAFLLGALALVACGSGSSSTQEPTEEPSALPAATQSYSGFLAASEFVVGANRFPFGLVDINGDFLEGAAVNVRFFLVEGETATLKTEAVAHWRTIPADFLHAHEDGEQHAHLEFRGIYVVNEVVLPEAGIWIADFAALVAGNSSPEIQEASFRVLPEANAPAVGSRVPATANLTINDTPFVELSTRRVERDELHNVSVAAARDTGKPFVVVFASPQFCVSAMCGPVVEVMDGAREALGGEVEFIHIEPWDLTAAREQGQLSPSPEALEWHLPTEPWVFVVDSDGRVAVRIEGLATQDEIVAAVHKLL
jgi:hypothetical protein